MWFHGSPLRLKLLAKGSTITRSREVARVFSHKPTIVSFEGEEEKFDEHALRRNGTIDGHLFEVLDVTDDDVVAHPTSTMHPGVEWITQRDLEVRWLQTTTPLAQELLTADDVAALRAQLETRTNTS